MKKLLLVLVCLINFYGQSQNFVGDNIEILENAVIEFKTFDSEISRNFRYRNIYNNFDTITRKFPVVNHKDRPFLNSTNYGYYSNYDSIVGKKFIIKGIYELPRGYDYTKYYCLNIYNEKIGSLYYKYDSESSDELEFKIISNKKEIDYCSYYGIHKDKFSNKLTYRSNNVQNISFVKVVENNTINIYMSIYIIGITANVGERGVYLLFDDGTKIIRKEVEINVDSTSKGFEYSAFFKLNKNELSILKNKTLTDYKLFIYDGTLNTENGFTLREYAKCLDKLN